MGDFLSWALDGRGQCQQRKFFEAWGPDLLKCGRETLPWDPAPRLGLHATKLSWLARTRGTLECSAAHVKACNRNLQSKSVRQASLDFILRIVLCALEYRNCPDNLVLALAQ